MKIANHYDVIVIGIGAMGSSACWYLSQRGHKVLGLEQFNIPHEKGSHSGQSRIIRKAYFEHPDYVPLLQHAYNNWKILEQETGESIYHRTGIVYFGKSDSETIRGTKSSATLYKVSITELPIEDALNKYPTFRVPNTFEAIVESDAGFVTPELAINLYTTEAKKKGAVIKSNTKVIDWKKEGNLIKVDTDTESFYADKLIVTAGSWTSKIIPTLKTKLKVTRQMLYWINPKKWDLFSLGKFPCWFIEDPDDGLFYGFPILPPGKFGGPIGLKIAHHYAGEEWNPDSTNSDLPLASEALLRKFISRYLPDADNTIIAAKQCLYTYSEDSNFIVDHLPGYDKQVTLACGFSGHGFKFASVIGEALADLSMEGGSDLPIGFLNLERFK